MITHGQKNSQRFINSIVTITSVLGLIITGAWSAPIAVPQAEMEAQPIQAEAETQPAEIPPTLNDIAAEIAADVGVVTTVVATDTQPAIFIFEERHDSVLGQVEIAIMLNRLYTDYGLRHIGLEGHMADAGPLDLAWAHRQPYYQPGQLISNREDVMTQTLQNGEIGSAELIGLIYHDVVVEGIDDSELYAFYPPADVWSAPEMYLYRVALAGMSNDEYAAWEALYAAEQYDEAFELAVSSDEFTAGVWQRLSDPVNIISAEEWILILDELQNQAEVVEADLTEEDVLYLAVLGVYFEHVSQRSDAMVAAMLDLVTAYPESPLAMTIGALHTARVVEHFREEGISFAVIRPRSLAEGSTVGLLSDEAYQRKQQGLSVAPAGTLGALLEGRGHKPNPTGNLDRYWLEIYLRALLQYLAERADELRRMGFNSPEEITKIIERDMRNVYIYPEGTNTLTNIERIAPSGPDPTLTVTNINFGDANYTAPLVEWTVTYKDPETSESKTLTGTAWALENRNPQQQSFAAHLLNLTNEVQKSNPEDMLVQESDGEARSSPQRICSTAEVLVNRVLKEP